MIDVDVDAGVDFDDHVTRGLRGYVWLVADALGLHGDSWCVQAEPSVDVYLALDGRLPGFPDWDVALLWDEEHGWSAAVETRSGEDLIVLAHMGDEVLPAPRAVAEWITSLFRDEHPAALPPAQHTDGDDDLVGRLAAYASATAVLMSESA